MSGLKTGSLRSDVWDHFEKGEKTANLNTAIENYRFVEAQLIYEIICYEIMESNISQRKTTMLTNITGRSTNLY